MNRRVFLTSLSAGTLLLACGCKPKAPYELAQIAGTVTYQGKPLDERFHIQFVPSDGTRPSMGKLDENGHYEAVHTLAQKGVKPGPCTIEIHWNANPNVTPVPDEYKELIAKYGFTGSEKLSVEIVGKDKKFDIDFK